MGTTKTGRTLNTRGAVGVASHYAVVHSNEGGYTHPQKGNRHSKDGVAVFGMWKGVRVGVIRTHGQIGTIFPDAKQPTKKGGKK